MIIMLYAETPTLRMIFPDQERDTGMSGVDSRRACRKTGDGRNFPSVGASTVGQCIGFSAVIIFSANGLGCVSTCSWRCERQ